MVADAGAGEKDALDKLFSTLPSSEAAPSVSRQHSSSSSSSSFSSPFAALGLSAKLARAVADEGYETPTPIQQQAIPHVLRGRDLLGCAQTGTGKTAAFVLPLLERLAVLPRGDGRIRALILAPTRELAIQIGERAAAYGRLSNLHHAVIYGGVSQRAQERDLRRQPDILIATPGRLLDLLGQRVVRLDGVQILVLDEADRMLDMGFIRDVRRIIALVPKKRQTLLFSATMPGDIAELARDVLIDPTRVAVAPDVVTADRVVQLVHFVSKNDKRAVLERVLRAEGATRTLVFTRTKHGANRLADQLSRGGIQSAAIHGNKSQSARERALDSFRRGTIEVLVATDIAARGIDIDGVTHVVNYELPNVPEQYVHRIGRTGRAGAEGRAISLVAEDERGLLRDVERFIRSRIEVASTTPPSAQTNTSTSTNTSTNNAPVPPPRREAPAANDGTAKPRRRRRFFRSR